MKITPCDGCARMVCIENAWEFSCYFAHALVVIKYRDRLCNGRECTHHFLRVTEINKIELLAVKILGRGFTMLNGDIVRCVTELFPRGVRAAEAVCNRLCEGAWCVAGSVPAHEEE